MRLKAQTSPKSTGGADVKIKPLKIGKAFVKRLCFYPI